MKKMSKTVIFFGNERLATGVTTEAPTLQALVEAGYQVAAVVSSYERGTSRAPRHLEIEEVAEKHGIAALLPAKLSDIKKQLTAYNADIAVLVAFGKIVSESIISLFPHGIINIHPSLLPKHRGPTPVESVILSGERKTGVSIMRLAKDMDAGPVYGQSEVTLSGNESKQALADQLLDVGKNMLIELLPGILSGDVVAMPQDDSSATYDNRIAKQDGVVAWTKPAVLIEREIRAYAEWPKSRATIAGKDVVITKAHVVEQNNTAGKIAAQGKELVIYTGKDALVVDKLKPAGKQEMTGEAFLAGHKHLF